MMAQCCEIFGRVLMDWQSVWAGTWRHRGDYGGVFTAAPLTVAGLADNRLQCFVAAAEILSRSRQTMADECRPALLNKSWVMSLVKTEAEVRLNPRRILEMLNTESESIDNMEPEETRRMAGWITMGSNQLFTYLQHMLQTSEQERELRWVAEHPTGVARPIAPAGQPLTNEEKYDHVRDMTKQHDEMFLHEDDIIKAYSLKWMQHDSEARELKDWREVEADIKRLHPNWREKQGVWDPRWPDGTPYPRTLAHLLNCRIQGCVQCGKQVIPLIRTLDELII